MVKRKYSKKFVDYTSFIANHPNYAGMPDAFESDGSVRWVAARSGPLGLKRLAWWNGKRAKLGIPKTEKWISKTARINHPTGVKPCQICGREMSLDYVYPTMPVINAINSTPGLKNTFSNLTPITQIIPSFISLLGKCAYDELAEIFKIPNSVKRTKAGYIDYVLRNCREKLSPGAMSNAPDRFDGFHSYDLCCRSKEDKGRSKENLGRYGEDRRAYEQWADGDLKAASWLMKKFRDHEGPCSICGRIAPLTADHIGPISLGFTHSLDFRPVCGSCNSSKNNRMTLADVKYLLEKDIKGERVVSWHSKYIWDLIKAGVRDDDDARILSKLMRTNMHHVLIILSIIAEHGYVEFLVRNFLHPEYAFFSIEFEGFNPLTGSYKCMKKRPGTKKQYEKSCKRYIRISLESLDEYCDKENRRVKKWDNLSVDQLVTSVLGELSKGNEKKAIEFINDALRLLAQQALARFNQQKSSRARKTHRR